MVQTDLELRVVSQLPRVLELTGISQPLLILSLPVLAVPSCSQRLLFGTH